jgi:hypothetical protein
MNPVSAFRDELAKIGAGLLDTVPRVNEGIDSLISLRDAIRTRGQEVLGHRNVAVPAQVFASLMGQGFTPTRLATPLPGEKFFRKTWRKGQLHAHQIGDEYFVHLDRVAPTKGLRQALTHFRDEGWPSLKKRLLEERM